MATVEMRQDEADPKVWWVYWVERQEIVARLDQDLRGRCRVTPHGPHWSPMKSMASTFESLACALHDVQLYFQYQ
jgi:hypothetical protein